MTRRGALRVAVALVALICTTPSPSVLAQASHPASSTSAPTLVLRGLDGQERTLTPTDLARLARHDTTVSAHMVTGRYSGVALTDVLALVNTPLADAKDGRPLAADEGPYRLIVPGEKRPARWARQIARISVVRAG